MIDIQSISTGLHLDDDGIWCTNTNPETSYPSSGHKQCFEVESHSFWFKHRNNCILSILQSYPPGNNETIFDIGGGNGFVALNLTKAGFNVVLVEPAKTGAVNAKKRGVKSVICATANTANFKPHTLPAVGLFDIIEHIEDDLDFLKSIRHLLKKRGHLYATVPSYSPLWSAEDVFAGHFRRYTLKSFINLLKSAGFEVKFASYIFRFLPVPIFFARTLPSKLGLTTTKNMSSSHTIKKGLTAKTINIMLQHELKTLNQRKPMSFGSSCLIVARNTSQIIS